jgi:hypothetical protein
MFPLVFSSDYAASITFLRFGEALGNNCFVPFSALGSTKVFLLAINNLNLLWKVF